jgi:polyisoprenoid-binding protein YceI
MLISTLCALGGLAALPLLLSATLTGAPAFSAGDAGTYAVDGVHSAVMFRIKHQDVSFTYGRFNEIKGEFVLAEKPADSSISIVIAAGSLDTGNAGRDEHIKGPDFLNSVQYPELTFTSTKVSKKSDEVYTVTGQLDLHGKQAEVTLDVNFVGAGDRGQRMGYLAGFEGHLTVNRRDFGIDTYPSTAIGDEIKLIIALEGQRQ